VSGGGQAIEAIGARCAAGNVAGCGVEDVENMETEGISVIIPTYNRAHLVARAVMSVLVTMAPVDELIVVDDGSTDGTEEVLADFRDRIRYIRQSNAGAGAARNHGIRKASRPLVALLDSDDEWFADKLRLQRAVMQAYPRVVYSFSDFAGRFLDGTEHHHIVAAWLRDPRTGFLDGPPSWEEILGPGVPFSSIAELPPGRGDFQVHVGNLYEALLETLCVWTCTFVARREAIGEGMGFAEDLPLYEDWQCFARLAAVGPVAYLDCETGWQNAHQGAQLLDLDGISCAMSRIRLLDRVWGSNPSFLAEHGRQYRRLMAKQHLYLASRLIGHGRLREGLGHLRQVRDSTLWDKLVTVLPGGLSRRLTSLRENGGNGRQHGPMLRAQPVCSPHPEPEQKALVS